MFAKWLHLKIDYFEHSNNVQYNVFKTYWEHSQIVLRAWFLRQRMEVILVKFQKVLFHICACNTSAQPYNI